MEHFRVTSSDPKKILLHYLLVAKQCHPYLARYWLLQKVTKNGDSPCVRLILVKVCKMKVFTHTTLGNSNSEFEHGPHAAIQGAAESQTQPSN